MFIGRERELGTLNKLYRSDKFEFAVIYGRRRVGKTALINEFIASCQKATPSLHAARLIWRTSELSLICLNTWVAFLKKSASNTFGNNFFAAIHR